PVDRQPRAGDVGAAGRADPLAGHALGALSLPPRPITHRGEALAEAHRRDPQIVDRAAVRGLQDAQAVLDRVEAQVHRDLVELALEREARLRRAVPALWPAGRLVRIHAHPVQL